MTDFRKLTELCHGLEGSPGRLAKLSLLAEFPAGLGPLEARAAVVFLTGRMFAASDPRVLGVRRLPDAPPGPAGPARALSDVAEAFAAVAEARGAGARQAREARLRELAARATPAERRILGRILAGEMRTGAADGLVLQAIPPAA